MLIIKDMELKFKRTLLHRTTLKFERGKIYTIYGKSGVGKSTLLNHIGLISKPNKEMQYIFNDNIVNVHNQRIVSDFIAKNIGFIFQNQNLMTDLTVYDNLCLPLQQNILPQIEVKNKIDEILLELQISHLRDKYPSDLSGGEEQRVAIARALIADKSIILADEPTNSLDSENRDIVIKLLTTMARQHNKIVIIVSHSEEVIAIGDEKYYFKNQKLLTNDQDVKVEITGRNWEQYASGGKNHHTKIRFRRRKESLSSIFIMIIAIIVSISVAAINFTQLFHSKYELMVENSLENSILVINDSLNINAIKVYDDFLKLDNELIAKIIDSSEIKSYEPYIEFPYFGLTMENMNTFGEEVRNAKPSLTVSGQMFALNSVYSIQPLFETHASERSLKLFDRTSDNGVYLSEQFISQNKLEDRIVAGSEIEIEYYVPIQLFENTITKDSETIQGDGDLFKKTSGIYTVLGIVSSQYPYDFSVYGNTVFMPIRLMKDIQNAMITSEERDGMINEIEGFSLIPWAPSAVQLTLSDSLEAGKEIRRISKIDSSLSLVSSNDDYKSFEKSLEYLQKAFLIISSILLVLVIALLFFVFYITNNKRKIEVGILKALGFEYRTILGGYLYELKRYIFKINVVALGSLALIAFALYSVLQTSILDAIRFILFSYIVLIPISVLVVISSGIIPIFAACKLSPVDTIRLNK